MKKKVGAILDEKLLVSARQLAISHKITLSQVFEEALWKYFKFVEKENKRGNIVEKTKGVMKTQPGLLKKVMEENAFYE